VVMVDVCACHRCDARVKIAKKSTASTAPVENLAVPFVIAMERPLKSPFKLPEHRVAHAGKASCIRNSVYALDPWAVREGPALVLRREKPQCQVFPPCRINPFEAAL